MEKRKHNVRRATVAFAMLLMFAIVVCTGTITYSRYNETETTTMQATVAKWGLVITMDVSNLFGTDYSMQDGANHATVVSSGNGVSVKATNSVVVPGSSGSITVTIYGKADVNSQLIFDFTGSKDIYLKQGMGKYAPLQWRAVSGIDGDFASGDLETIISNITQNYRPIILPAGYELPEEGMSFTMSWRWDFADELYVNSYDTILTRLANGEPLDVFIEEYSEVIDKNNTHLIEYSENLSFCLSANLVQI